MKHTLLAFLLMLSYTHVSAQDGSIDHSFNVIDNGTLNNYFSSDINDLIVLSDGKILCAGSFTLHGSTTVNRIARLNADGSLDATFQTGSGFNSYVNTMDLQPDGKIIVGGNFTTYNGATANYIVRLNADGTIDPSFNTYTGLNPGFNNYINKVKVLSSGKILVAGSFHTYNNQYATAINITRLNADGSWDNTFATNTEVVQQVNDFEFQSDGKILIAGAFLNIYKGGVSYDYSRFARLDANGELDLTFNIGTGFSERINDFIIQNDGKILVGGLFDTYNGTESKRFCRLNADGTIDAQFTTNLGTGFTSITNTTGTNIQVRKIHIKSNGELMVGGTFYHVNGLVRSNLATLHADGTVSPVYNGGFGFSGSVKVIVPSVGNTYFIGGVFSAFNNMDHYKYLIRINADISLDYSFNMYTGFMGAPTTVKTLPNGKMMVTGNFTLFNGQIRNRITRIHADGSDDPTFVSGTGFNNSVVGVETLANNQLLVVGGFNNYNGLGNNGIVRLHADGSQDQSYISPTYASMYKALLKQPDGKIIITGNFNLAGNFSTRIARLNTDGSLDSTFSAGVGPDNTIECIALQSDGKILAGGNFTTWSGANQKRIIRLNSNGSVDTTFVTGTGFDGSVMTISSDSNGKIYVGGGFQNYNGVAAKNMISLNADGSVNTFFETGTGFSSTVYEILVESSGKLVIGGNFETYNSVAANHIVRLLPNGLIDNSFASGTGCDEQVSAIFQAADGKLLVCGLFNEYNGERKHGIMRLNNCLAPMIQVQTITDCPPYQWINGTTYTSTTNNAIHTIPGGASNGCDSIIMAHLILTDNAAPVAPELDTLFLSCDYTMPQITAEDACAGTITGTLQEPFDEETFGTYSITWEFNDGNGNTSTAPQIVVLDDRDLPVLPAITPIVIHCDSTLEAPIAVDHCTGNILATTTDNLTFSTPGTYQVAWYFDDSNGNDTTVYQQVQLIELTDSVSFVDEITLEAETVDANYQWYSCADQQPLPGETNQTFTATANGDYYVEITGIGGCQVTSPCFTISTVNIAEWSQSTWTLFPNPAQEVLTLQSSVILSEVPVVIYTQDGKKVREYSFNGTSLNMQLETLTDGVYYIQIDQLNHMKFIKN